MGRGIRANPTGMRPTPPPGRGWRPAALLVSIVAQMFYSRKRFARYFACGCAELWRSAARSRIAPRRRRGRGASVPVRRARAKNTPLYNISIFGAKPCQMAGDRPNPPAPLPGAGRGESLLQLNSTPFSVAGPGILQPAAGRGILQPAAGRGILQPAAGRGVAFPPSRAGKGGTGVRPAVDARSPLRLY
jgi:hypothetical protein